MSLFVPTEFQRRALDASWRRYDVLVRQAARKKVTADVVHAARRAIEDQVIANERGFNSVDEARAHPVNTNHRRRKGNA